MMGTATGSGRSSASSGMATSPDPKPASASPVPWGLSYKRIPYKLPPYKYVSATAKAQYPAC